MTNETKSHEWKPRRVQGLESEKAALEKRLGEVNAERDDLQKSIGRVNDAINAEMRHGSEARESV